MLEAARNRVETTLCKILKKHKEGVIAVVAPEPLASLIRCYLLRVDLGNLWKAECVSGGWESIEVEPTQVAVNTR